MQLDRMEWKIVKTKGERKDVGDKCQKLRAEIVYDEVCEENE